MSDDRLKRTLQDEMRQVSFSKDDKRRIAMQLKQAMAARADKVASMPERRARWRASTRPRRTRDGLLERNHRDLGARGRGCAGPDRTGSMELVEAAPLDRPERRRAAHAGVD